MLTVHCCRYRSGDLAAKTANEMTYTVLGWSISSRIFKKNFLRSQDY